MYITITADNANRISIKHCPDPIVFPKHMMTLYESMANDKNKYPNIRVYHFIIYVFNIKY